MRKFVVVALLALFGVGMVLGGFPGEAQAGVFPADQNVKTVSQVGDGVVTTLTTNDRILGFWGAFTTAGAGSLYDTDGLTTASDALLIGEVNAPANTSSLPVWFPGGRKITTGVTVVTTNTTDVITIVYE